VFAFLKQLWAWTSDKNKTETMSNIFRNSKFTKWRRKLFKITAFFFPYVYTLFLFKQVVIGQEVMALQ